MVFQDLRVTFLIFRMSYGQILTQLAHWFVHRGAVTTRASIVSKINILIVSFHHASWLHISKTPKQGIKNVENKN